jgi:hypothetical protein
MLKTLDDYLNNAPTWAYYVKNHFQIFFKLKIDDIIFSLKDAIAISISSPPFTFV